MSVRAAPHGSYSAAYGNVPTLCKGFGGAAAGVLRRVKPSHLPGRALERALTGAATNLALN
jgi:hypothetical protein